MNDVSFKGTSIISCGTMRKELGKLQQEGFLDVDRIFFTTPGLHEIPRDLENQLVRQISRAKELSEKIIVVYGDRCFVDSSDFFRSLDKVIEEQGNGILRIKAHNCIDMLASDGERDALADGRKVYWLVPGWIEYRNNVFLDWDQGKANETFPANDTAIILDSIGYFESLAMENPDALLGFSDWMGIPVEPLEIPLDRLKHLLSDCLDRL
ncbi:MAG: DUF1638 domain-containing protein [Actinobacteria bacterium]|nr:DUF1638 domain-containing protein [Actinomycetota bacterium]